MNRFVRGLVFCSLSLMLGCGAALAASPIGKVVSILGAPSASGPGGDRKLGANAAVFENDKITVGSSGNAQIILNDGTKLVVGPSSTLLLDRFVMKGSSGAAESIGIKALRGTFRFITGKSKKSAYNIATSNATIGIRGTGFDFWVKNNTGVLVMIGSVNLNNNHGKSVLVRADCEMGRSTPNEARRLTGNTFAQSVRTNLPYVLNQSSLNRLFRLPIENCRTLLAKAGAVDENQGNDDKNKGQSTPPRPEDPGNECGQNGCD
jgi:hypothetical protein